MNHSIARPLTSVIIPCCDQVGFTQHCLQSLFRFTRPGWELIVIDNGSTDGTGLYLAGVRDAARVPVTVISNRENLGFPRAVNQGLQAARGEYLVLLNNDAVVTDGWLDQLIALSRAPVETPNESTDGEEGRSLTTKVTKDTKGRQGEAGGERQPAGIGLVGPMSNYAPPPQLVEDVPYRDLEEMHAFARRWRDEHRGQWFTVGKLSGFCLLMKRAVYEAVGGLDERFGPGFFDDDDLAVRARRAGFELAVAHDLFVHHFGSRTFAGHGIDAERLLEANARKFAEKWGHEAPAARRVALRPWGAGVGQESFHSEVGGGAQGRTEETANGAEASVLAGRDARHARKARVSLTMIVRDEEANLPRALESVRGVFDEIVVVDTGSVDRTREIAREFGAKVVEFAWIDDFAAARNVALDHATGDYVFWLDADDVIEAIQRERLVALLAGLEPPPGRNGGRCHSDGLPTRPPEADTSPTRQREDPGGAHALAGATGSYRPTATRGPGARESPTDTGGPDGTGREGTTGADGSAAYVVRCACDPGADGSGGETVVDHIRLFPLRPDVRWTYRVHEQILPALRRAGVPVRWTDLVVRHTGYVDVALRARKLERDARILVEELAERPDEPFLLFNLGAIAIERKDWRAALDFLGQSLARSAPSDSITRKLFALIARAHQKLGDSVAALRICEEGLSRDPGDAELLFRKAVVHRQRGEPAEAEGCWRAILGLRRPETFASVDMGIYGHLTRRNLAALAAERGEAEEERRLWAAVLAECPGDPEAMARLGRPGPAGARP